MRDDTCPDCQAMTNGCCWKHGLESSVPQSFMLPAPLPATPAVDPRDEEITRLRRELAEAQERIAALEEAPAAEIQVERLVDLLQRWWNRTQRAYLADEPENDDLAWFRAVVAADPVLRDTAALLNRIDPRRAAFGNQP